jgi:flavin-dependent dehydrogenase
VEPLKPENQNRAETDVIVIGGGAAGCSTAIYLARRGRQVVLLEGHPDRPPQLGDLHSGEVLSPGSQLELERLGLDLTQAQTGDYLSRWKLQEWATLRQHWPGGRETTDRLPPGVAFWQINRGNFYRALRRLARSEGVEVRAGVRVIDLLRDSAGRCQGVLAREVGQPVYELRAPVTVDASGRNSVVLARLGLRQPEPHFQRAAYLLFFSELAGAPEPGVWQQYWLRRATTLRGSYLAPRLYRFSFETSLAERAGWLEKFGRLPAHDLFLAARAEQLPQEAGRFREATRLPHLLAFAPIGFRVDRITHDGLLMAGDASGYLDPSTGQGIEFALRLGRLAAHSIAGAFDLNRFDRAAFDGYLSQRQAEVQPIVRRLRLFLQASRSHWLLDGVGGFAPARQAVMRQLIKPRPAILD